MGRNSIEDFSKEERASISKDFRAEIKQHGLGHAILSVVESDSEKVIVKKRVLAQQCRKSAFAQEFSSTCRRLAISHPRLVTQLVGLQAEMKRLR